MQIHMPPSAIGRAEPAANSDKAGEPQGKIAQLQAKADKIQKQISVLTKPYGDDVPTDKESAKLRQEQVKILLQQLALVMAEIARLKADAAKKEEPVGQEQATPPASTANNLPMNSTFSITV